MDKYQKFVNNLGKKYLRSHQLKFDEYFKNHTTFQIGGPAKIFFEAKNTQELVTAISSAYGLKLPYFILGGGSNILVGDLGFKGVVIKNKLGKIKILGYKGRINRQKSMIKDIYVRADSGVSVNRLVRFTLDRELSGLENFLGLPGTIGGAIYGNAHNVKFKDFFGNYLFEAFLVDCQGKTKKIDKEYFNFAYDKSRIQQTGEVVLTATFSLKKGDKKRLWQKANAVMDYRLKTQPLDTNSAGCIFKNIKKSEAIAIPTPGLTISAGFLIEAAGLKGKRVGEAEVSSLHANFILNRGKARASDVLKLIKLIKKRVKEKFNVSLEEEIKMVGEFS